MKKRSKRYQTTEKLVNKDKVYTLKEAVNLLKSLAQPKFAGSLDLHFNLNVDTKKSDQMIRGTVVLPHGTGRKVKIAVFCKGEQERDARDAQADYVGAGDLMEKVAAGFLDFDCVIATPDMMKDLSKLGKILGPKGLMPSPKTGTVTTDVAKAIGDVRKGKVEFRVDKQGGIHLSAGKLSFSEEQLLENANCVIDAINEAKPGSVKGKFVKAFAVSSTMNPGMRVAI
ncbi:MAG: 50S ribosomal protein L1 [Candidatus Omnitrophota bacterium]|jgi:large subunit ribosomal protein L1|nr:50S ribosomal protein L1 [Candidatus Omnitrophota bacterium]